MCDSQSVDLAAPSGPPPSLRASIKFDIDGAHRTVKKLR